MKVEKVESIKGWGLNPPPDDGWFRRISLGGRRGCDSDTCRHLSHGSAADFYAWIPNNNVILFEMIDDDWDKGRETYFIAKKGNELRFIKIEYPQHHHAQGEYVDTLPF